ncbi:MAG: M48 family metalloprotease [Caulobacterales bacterium]
MLTLRASIAAVLVPVLGLALALYIDAGGGVVAPAQTFASAYECLSALPANQGCSSANYTTELAASAVAALLLGGAILLGYTLAAQLCGANRLALAWIFPPATFVALVAISMLTLLHAIIVALGVFAAERYWLGQTHAWIAGAIAGLGFAAAAGVAWSAVRSFGPARVTVIGSLISPMDQPRLMLAVRRLARAVGAPAPDHVVVGMDANFFVTNAQVLMPGLRAPLRGRTMFLSAPLMRGLTAAELRGVIAHELAHFANKDLAYSQMFAPVYARLMDARGRADGAKKNANPFLWPVGIFTEFMVARFHRNVARVSRIREFAADQRAAEATSAQDLATSLLKVSILTDLWQREYASMIERVRAGRFSRNLARNFEDQIKYDLDRKKVGDMMQSVLAWHVPHPTDAHPPTDDRINALGLDAEELLSASASFDDFFGKATAAEELDDLTELEEALTWIYQKVMVDVGVGIEKEMDREEFARRVLIDLIAHMIVVDGMVDDREIEMAEREAASFVSDFDPRDLRERCRHPSDLPDLDRLIEVSIDILTPVGFKRLAAILEKVSKADGMQHVKERRMLERVLAAAEVAEQGA